MRARNELYILGMFANHAHTRPTTSALNRGGEWDTHTHTHIYMRDMQFGYAYIMNQYTSGSKNVAENILSDKLNAFYYLQTECLLLDMFVPMECAYIRPSIVAGKRVGSCASTSGPAAHAMGYVDLAVCVYKDPCVTSKLSQTFCISQVSRSSVFSANHVRQGNLIVFSGEKLS